MNEVKSLFALLRNDRVPVNESAEDSCAGCDETKPNEEVNGCLCPQCSSGNVAVVNEADGIYQCSDCGYIFVKKTPVEETEEGSDDEKESDEAETNSDEADIPDEENTEDAPEKVEDEVVEYKATFCPIHGLVSGVGAAQVTVCPICGEPELSVKKVRIVGEDDGELEVYSGLTEAQKKALSKARKVKRLSEENTITCDVCGFTGALDEFTETDGVFHCPECGSEVEVVERDDTITKFATEDDEETKEVLESIGAPKAIFTALKNGKRDIVNNYISRKVK